jgi:hypothetical protein
MCSRLSIVTVLTMYGNLSMSAKRLSSQTLLSSGFRNNQKMAFPYEQFPFDAGLPSDEAGCARSLDLWLDDVIMSADLGCYAGQAQESLGGCFSVVVTHFVYIKSTRHLKGVYS